MKKIVFLSLLLLIGIYSDAQRFRLGFQASPHFSWMKSSDGNITNAGSRFGIKYGLDADIFLAGLPRYSLNTGLFISNHSFKARYNLATPFTLKDATFYAPVDITYDLGYIEIPINIKLRSDQFFRITYWGQFGLAPQINISATATSSDGKFNGGSVSEVIGLFNLDLLVGGGIEYDFGGHTSINLGLQYSNGFVDISTYKNIKETTTINAIRLVVGVMF